MLRGLCFRRELLGRREQLPRLLQLHPRMLPPLPGADFELQTILDGFSSAEYYMGTDCCGGKRKSGAPILKMSTVGQGWIRFFMTVKFALSQAVQRSGEVRWGKKPGNRSGENCKLTSASSSSSALSLLTLSSPRGDLN